MMQPSESSFATPAHVLLASTDEWTPRSVAESNPLAFLLRETCCDAGNPFDFLHFSSNPGGVPSPVTGLPDHARLQIFNEFEHELGERASVLGILIGVFIHTRADALGSLLANYDHMAPMNDTSELHVALACEYFDQQPVAGTADEPRTFFFL